MKALIAIAALTVIYPASALADAGHVYTFKATYQGIEFETANLTAEECMVLVARPTVEVMTEDGTSLIVAASETTRACVSTLADRKAAAAAEAAAADAKAKARAAAAHTSTIKDRILACERTMTTAKTALLTRAAKRIRHMVPFMRPCVETLAATETATEAKSVMTKLVEWSK